MKAIATVTFPDASYEIHSRTANETEVVFFATFKGTHKGIVLRFVCFVRLLVVCFGFVF